LLIDEATSDIDPQTARLLSEAMTDAGADRTMITIAHRIETVLGADRILVMADGRVRELDTPAALLADDHSELRQLAGAHAFVDLDSDPNPGAHA
jgi:ABC-type multidrug transport system fused ATPase/permease subunit